MADPHNHTNSHGISVSCTDSDCYRHADPFFYPDSEFDSYTDSKLDINAIIVTIAVLVALGIAFTLGYTFGNS